MTEGELYTVAEVAGRLKVDAETVRRWIRAKEMDAVYLGARAGYRVSQDALREAVHSEQAFQVGGQYSPEAAKAALAQAGISLQAYEQDLRTQVQRVQLEGGIRASDFLTPLELTRLTDLE